MWSHAETILPMNVMDILGPVIVAVVYISLCSLFEEPNRRKFNAMLPITLDKLLWPAP